MAKTQKEFALNLPCKLKRLSVGDQTGNLGISITRSDSFSLDAADRFLCGRRLIGMVLTAREDEDARQTNFLDGERHLVKAAFDVKAFRVSPKMISCSLVFALGEIDVRELAQLANQNGRLLVEEVGELSEDEAEEETEDGEEGDDE